MKDAGETNKNKLTLTDKTEIKNTTGLVWFGNDLRIHDNDVLSLAIKNHSKVIGTYIIDPLFFEENEFGFKKMDVFRTQFLLETLSELKASLKAKNISLIIETKAPEVSLPQWIEQLDITDLYYQKEWLQEERNTALAVHKQLNPQVQVHTYYDQFLFHPEEVPMDLESIPEVFTVFRKQCEKMSQVRPCLGEPKIFDQKNLLTVFCICLLTDVTMHIPRGRSAQVDLRSTL